MSKKNITPEQKYKSNQKKAKVFKVLSPVFFWLFLCVSITCLIFAIRNSFGNVAEIIDMLNTKVHTGEELRANYDYLIDKYGEWVIGTGGQGWTLSFVNIGNALFSKLMIINTFMAIMFFIMAFISKWIFPKISQAITTDNQDMVNLTILKGQENQKE